MKNFDYLKDKEPLKDLYAFCNAAEDTQQSNYDVCALNCRRALEWIVRSIYTLKGIENDKRTSLLELMTGEPFTQFVGGDDKMMMAAHYVRKVGNKAAHDGNVKKTDAFFSLLNTYNVVGGILLKLGTIETLKPFDKELIPSKPALTVMPKEEVPKARASFLTAEAKAYVKNPRIINGKIDYSEAETRRKFIDILLQEAGWQVLDKDGAIVPSKACIEIAVDGIEGNPSGIGYADYVLFGANGSPLAVVEAKKTIAEEEKGRTQAIEYAESLERRYGVRPVIYFSNGFSTKIIDGVNPVSRNVSGFHTEKELTAIMLKRGRGKITDLTINDDITDREYQKRAIKKMCEHFNDGHRKGLIVMATGTGKTRVSISLSDVLMRNGWVKNILFLADRKTLVKQAMKSFTQLLPNTTTARLDEFKPSEKQSVMNARILFSTYNTMVNYIDAERKEFSIGRFDLIIVDEVHRSIFGKYTSILTYFDAMMLGMTATPREDDDRSTYELFERESKDPNFEYTLEEAVRDGKLVTYELLSRTTEILKNGIKYDALSDEEKEQMDSVWEYEKAKYEIDPTSDYKRDIQSREIFNYIFNKDTIDKVLVDLMENGLKINGGETLGKTIIFAYNHKHASLIVERFKKLYPSLGDDFCQLIDNQVKGAQGIIDSFEVRGKMPQLAVSVDMLDTGVDVPDILNLVFFKQVHSKIKFMQMIGRGTRLSKGIFDEGENDQERDKKTFYIFDWCGNFEFFGKNPKGAEPQKTLSLTERLFNLRLDLAIVLQHEKFQSNEDAKALHDKLKETLRGQVVGLNDNHISVREKMRFVDKYRQEKVWEYLSNVDGVEIKNNVSPLLVGVTKNIEAIKFDILMSEIELSNVDESVNGSVAIDVVITIAEKLKEKASIKQVMDKMPLIKQIAEPNFWEGTPLGTLEKVRKEIRELAQFTVSGSNQLFTINIRDVVDVKEDPTKPVVMEKSYKKKVIEYLAENRELTAIQKIVRMEQLTSHDISELERICWKELGTKEDYEKYVANGHMICGDSVGAFIRSQIGVDRHIAMERFSKFLSDTELNSMQEEYIKSIIAYVCENGDITTNTLMEVEPFSGYEWIDTFGQRLVAVRNYVNEIHNIVRVANGEDIIFNNEMSDKRQVNLSVTIHNHFDGTIDNLNINGN